MKGKIINKGNITFSNFILGGAVICYIGAALTFSVNFYWSGESSKEQYIVRARDKDDKGVDKSKKSRNSSETKTPNGNKIRKRLRSK